MRTTSPPALLFERTRVLVLALTAACASGPPTLPEGYEGGSTHAYHDGPLVAWGAGGPGRFAEPVLAAFDADAAMETARFVDGFYREPANEGFDAVLDHVLAKLEVAGFGTSDGFELRVDERPLQHLAWTPRRASLELFAAGGGDAQMLLRFGHRDDRQRTMLPANAPSADVTGPIVFAAADVSAGSVLVTDLPLDAVLDAAAGAGAAAVLSSYLRDYNLVDPTGAGRERDSILYTSVPPGTALAVCQISPAAYDRLRAAGAGASVRLRAVVELAARPLRTIVATIVGARNADQVVPMVAHVQEPGASDNASGVAGLLESACSLARAIEAGDIVRPTRGVAFVWGDEMTASHVFLETTERTIPAAFSADMVGASKEQTGAICLLERTPDPGALTPLPPDAHTPWGAGEVNADELVPNGLSIITRLALVDVGIAARGWETREHPWEGGSDHDVFLGRGIPAVLLWHFTDFAYHTSLDRLDHVDAQELELTCAALLCAALAVADARPTDLDRYLDSLKLERRLRIAAVEVEGADRAVADQWVDWFTGARHWLRALCLGLPLPSRE